VNPDEFTVTLNALRHVLNEMGEERVRNAFDYDKATWRGQIHRRQLAGKLRALRRAIASTRVRAYHARLARVA